MPWIALVAAGIAGVASMSAADSASDAQVKGGREAIGETRRQYDQTRADLAPYRNVGTASLYKLADLLGLPGGGRAPPTSPSRQTFYTNTPGNWSPGIQYSENHSTGPSFTPGVQSFDQTGYDSALAQYQRNLEAYNTPGSDTGALLRPFQFTEDDPSYRFRQQEGSNAITSDAAARGLRLSPATQKALLRFNSDLASTEFGAAFNRDMATKQNTYNMLAGVSGTGQTAATQTGVLGANAANNIAGIQQGIGNSQAAGIVGQANAFNSALSTGANAWQQQRQLDQYLKAYGGGSMGWTDSQGYGVG